MQSTRSALGFALLAGLGSACASEPPAAGLRVLFDFTATDAARGWRNVDDVVMGGVSQSTFTRTDDGLGVFAGRVSLENGGGFASVRSPDLSGRSGAATGLDGFGALELDLRGDGKTYKLNVRLDGEYDGVVWQRAFTAPAGAWTRVTIAFGELEPTFRGRRVPDAGAFDPARVASLGLIVSEKQAGPFRLELRKVSAVPAASPRP